MRRRRTKRKGAARHIKYLAAPTRRRRSRRRRSLRGDLPVMLAGRRRRHSRRHSPRRHGRRRAMLGGSSMKGILSKGNIEKSVYIAAGSLAGYMGGIWLTGMLADSQPKYAKYAPLLGLLAPSFFKSDKMKNFGIGMAAGAVAPIAAQMFAKYFPGAYHQMTAKAGTVMGDDLVYVAMDAPPTNSGQLQGEVHYGGGALLGSKYVMGASNAMPLGATTSSSRYLGNASQQTPLGASNAMPLGLGLGNLEQRQVLAGTNALI